MNIDAEFMTINEYKLSKILLTDQFTLEQELLTEGVTMDGAKDVIQYLISAAGEYGLGTVTLPAAGAGLAVGPTVETVVDSFFSIETIASTVQTIKSISKTFGQFKEIIQNAYKAWTGGDLESYYKAVRNLVQSGLIVLGKGAQDAVKAAAKELKEGIEKVINKLIRPIEQGIKLVIPEATIGTAAAKMFKSLLEKIANNAYSLSSKIINQFDMLKNFIKDPEAAVDFFENLITGEGGLTSLIRKMADKLDNTGFFTKVAGVAAATAMTAGAGAVPAAALAAFGSTGLQKLADMLDKRMPLVISTIKTVLTIVMPFGFALLATFEILMKGEWEKPKDEKAIAKKEGINMKDNELILERWQRLAGIPLNEIANRDLPKTLKLPFPGEVMSRDSARYEAIRNDLNPSEYLPKDNPYTKVTRVHLDTSAIDNIIRYVRSGPAASLSSSDIIGNYAIYKIYEHTAG